KVGCNFLKSFNAVIQRRKAVKGFFCLDNVFLMFNGCETGRAHGPTLKVFDIVNVHMKRLYTFDGAGFGEEFGKIENHESKIQCLLSYVNDKWRHGRIPDL